MYLTKLINNIENIITKRGKDNVSTLAINNYITDNKNVIALLNNRFDEHLTAEIQKGEGGEGEGEEEQILKALRESQKQFKEKLMVRVKNLLPQSGGKKSKKLPKKEILGKMRCIYKIPGDRKEYLKHKGKLITVKEYKELMKAKLKKKEAKPKKKEAKPKKKEVKPKKVKKPKSKK